MILTCPSCSTRYLVPDTAIGADGRRVRCTKCSFTWFQSGPEPGSDALLDRDSPPPLERAVEAESISVERVVRPIPPGSNLPALPQAPARAGTAVGWLALLAVLAVLAGLAVLERDRLAALWPPLERAYELVGWPLPVLGAGLAFEQVVPVRRDLDGSRLVEVDGRIANLTEHSQRIPAIRVALLDAERREIAAQIYAPAADSLAAGAKLPFAVAFAAGGREVAEVAVRFAPRDGADARARPGG